LSKPQIRNQVATALRKEARGIFLWVKLIVQELEKQRTLTGVRDVLQSLPLGMENLYARILEALLCILRDEQSRITAAVFGWIACVTRPLRVDELTKAIELTLPDIGELLDLTIVLQEDCGALVSVTTTSIVQFIHQTAHQYVCSDRCSSTFAVDRVEMHKKITKVCITYLSRAGLSEEAPTRFQCADKEQLAEKFPLLSYAAMYWPEHLALADIENDVDLVETLSTFLLSSNLLFAIEIAVTIGGVDSLRHWLVCLAKCKGKIPTRPREGIVDKFVVDLQHVVYQYGHVLNKFPSEIYYIVDECFPRTSYFWNYFSHPEFSVTSEITFASGQSEEWDPCVVIFDNVHVNSIAVNSPEYLAAADAGGISILNLHTRVEVSRLPTSNGTTIAMTFNQTGDILAALTNDGSVQLMSTRLWEVTKTMPQMVPLPAVINNWDESRFWSLYFLHFDPLHVNFGFIGSTLYAANTLLDTANGKSGKRTKGLVNMSNSSTCTVSQFSSTSGGELMGLAADGNILKRRIGKPRGTIVSRPSNDDSRTQQYFQRLLAVSNTGKFIATCRVDIFKNYAMSQSLFECINVGTPARCFEGRFGVNNKITAAAFSADESTLAVTAHDAGKLLDTTKIWSLAGEPHVIWERVIFDDHTTSLAFALNDTILVKAGRFVSVWDTSLIYKSKKRDACPFNLALKLSPDGKYIASVPGEQVSIEHQRLFLRSTEQQGTPVEFQWPSHLQKRNIHLTEPIAFSPDGAFIVWDQTIFSLTTHELDGALLLQEGEKVCRIGGLSHDSSVAVFGVDKRPPRLRRRDIPLDQLDTPRSAQTTGDWPQHVVTYDIEKQLRQFVFSTDDLSMIRTHSDKPLVGFVARGSDSKTHWTAYVYSLTSRQCIASAAFPQGLPLDNIIDVSFRASSESFDIALPHGMWRHGRDFGGAWTDVDMVSIRQMAKTENVQCGTATIPKWHICHLLPSGKCLYFLQDGWIMLWDNELGYNRIKYLPPRYRWSISSCCTAATELNGVIRVAIQSLSMGLFWFDIEIENLDGIEGENFVSGSVTEDDGDFETEHGESLNPLGFECMPPMNFVSDR
jgi:GPI inositol-deacylase, winged helix domain